MSCRYRNMWLAQSLCSGQSTLRFSAASYHFSLLAVTFTTTSRIFVPRSISVAGNCCRVTSTPASFSHPRTERQFA